MNDLPGAIDLLGARLQSLERRVYALEHPSAAPVSLAAPEPVPQRPARAGEALSTAFAGGVFSVLGKAMLGIAGAYLLRAVAESSALPRPLVASVAVAYAILWLVWAARMPAGTWFASAAYACTSALILAPMLWELTLRFKILPAPATACVLGAFVGAAFALTWKRHLAPVMWVTCVAAAAAAIALSVASHRMAPFLAVLLLMAVLCEYAAGRNRQLGVRVFAAAAANLGVWAFLSIYSSPQSARADYPLLGAAVLLAPGFTLFLVFAASVIWKTMVRRRKITAFETIQAIVAFLLAAFGLLSFGPAASAAILGACCFALSAIGYTAAFAFFDHARERCNYEVFATWSAALFLAGSLLCLPPWWTDVCLCAAAIAATVAGVRLGRLMFEFHGAAYLMAAAAVSGLLGYLVQALAGTLPGAPGWGVCLVSACAALCYAAIPPRRGEPWKPQVLHILFASLAAGAVMALLVQGLAGLLALKLIPGAHHLAFIRTLTLCAAALALAFSGAHWRRLELTRIGYATLVLVAVKLVAEDLRLGHLEYIAASIFLFALTLIAVPRVARAQNKA